MVRHVWCATCRAQTQVVNSNKVCDYSTTTLLPSRPLIQLLLSLRVPWDGGLRRLIIGCQTNSGRRDAAELKILDPRQTASLRLT